MGPVRPGKPSAVPIRDTEHRRPQMESVDANRGCRGYWLSQDLCVPMCIEGS